jgi:FKBP-type peptidyl-prolyl cis-trans isomerase
MKVLVLFCFWMGSTRAWGPTSTSTGLTGQLDRRSSLLTVLAVSVPRLLSGRPASAAVDKPQEFKNVGTQAPTPDGTAPFVTLENGVKIKDFRAGTGDSAVGPKSRVDIQCSGRLLNLNGVVFYNTKTNNSDGFAPVPLTIELGKGQAIPGLEAGLVGMKKGGIRRIIVPQELAYNAFPDLEPKPVNANDQRALDSVVKNPRRDGTILLDVSLERFK